MGNGYPQTCRNKASLTNTQNKAVQSMTSPLLISISQLIKRWKWTLLPQSDYKRSGIDVHRGNLRSRWTHNASHTELRFVPELNFPRPNQVVNIGSED